MFTWETASETEEDILTRVAKSANPSELSGSRWRCLFTWSSVWSVCFLFTPAVNHDELLIIINNHLSFCQRYKRFFYHPYPALYFLHVIKFHLLFNHLTPRSDQHVTSPYYIHTEFSKQVTRILKLIR